MKKNISKSRWQRLVIKIMSLIFILLLITIPLSAAETKNESIISYQPVREFFLDLRDVSLSPLRWEEKEWLTASLVVGTTVVLYNHDTLILESIQGKQNKFFTLVSRMVQPLGNGFYVLPSLAGVYLYGYSLKDQQMMENVGLCMKSYLLSSSLVQMMKLTGHRHRPNTGDPYNTWDGPGFYFENLSFPSGHSAGAFSLASVLATIYREKKYVPALVYGLAGLTAISRIYDNMHWPSDVFFGSALGYFSGKAVMALDDKHKDLVIVPTLPGPDQYGFSLLYHF